MRTCASLFSGGGLAEVGLKAAGLTPLWGVEYDPAIAGVYAANHGPHIIVGDVRVVDFAALARPDLLWASPPCPSFSVAKTDRGETETDREIAAAVIRALTVLRPAAFVLENVEGYVHSDSYRAICAALDGLDYWRDAEVVNAADLGTPQTRRRLILRARAGGWMQAHRPWPAPVAWRGWYAAIEDLIPTLPDSAFAPWQLARLPAELRESVMVPCDNTQQEWGKRYRVGAEPAPTMSTDRKLRAFILDGQNTTGDGKLISRASNEPTMTVFASSVKGMPRAYLVNGTSDMGIRHADDPAQTILATVHGKAANARALIPPGRVVAMTPRALARFQGLPDTYTLPEKKALACRVIGNGVAVAVAEWAARTLLDDEYLRRAA
jgi:DNA (cytosine-5)-methyltransferase 1